jgi:hypothetical protein
MLDRLASRVALTFSMLACSASAALAQVGELASVPLKELFDKADLVAYVSNPPPVSRTASKTNEVEQVTPVLHQATAIQGFNLRVLAQETGCSQKDGASEEICTEECPHCGSINVLPGFSEMIVYTCQKCGKAVTLLD